MNGYSALVIGAGGGLGKATIQMLLEQGEYLSVHGVSRQEKPADFGSVAWHQMDTSDENKVSELVQSLKQQGSFSTIICCTGALHCSQSKPQLEPEKRLEDIDPNVLLHYFMTNTIVPTIWLKHGLTLLKGNHRANFVLFSARVGSISDNKLGGWYGYRASKSALNMMIKTAQVEYRRRAPNVCLVSYHPGTVDTPLSEPFQSNVSSDKLFTPQFSANQLLKIIPDLSLEEAPHYVDWQGKSIPW